jgi:hypothetical protein
MRSAMGGYSEKVGDVIEVLERHGHQAGWIGTDPYEGLNATRLVTPLKRTFRGRQLIIQAVKRSPVDLRKPLGIRPAVNSATLAWVASSYARKALPSDADNSTRLQASIARLDEMQCTGYDEPCWGYHFDTQSRVFFYSKTAPNTIATSFVGQAFIDAYEQLDERWMLDRAIGAGDFFLNQIHQTPAEAGAYFGYIVGDRNSIQNANTHVAALLGRLSVYDGCDRFREPAIRAVEYALDRQRDDGSWLYGERPDLAWVDGYHHGYVLDALHTCDVAGLDPRLPEAIDRGLAFYRDDLLLPDGTPKYFSDKVLPIDSQSYAQAIQTFAIASARDESYLDQARSVFDWTLENMQRKDGLFMFQRRRYWANPLPHMRWVVAALLLALTHMKAAEEKAAS